MNVYMYCICDHMFIVWETCATQHPKHIPFTYSEMHSNQATDIIPFSLPLSLQLCTKECYVLLLVNVIERVIEVINL